VHQLMENGNEWDKISKTKSSVVMLVIIMVNQLFAIQKIYAVEKNDVKVAYREFLSEKNLLWTNRYTTDEGIKFRLEDLNKDDKQELLIYDEYGSNATGQLAVYAYINRKVKYIASYPLWKVTFYRNKVGFVYSEIYRDGYEKSYQVYNGKKIKQKYTCQGFYDDSMKKTVETYYDSKGNKISKKTVKNQIRKLKKNGKKLTISEGANNMYLNNKDNWDKYILLKK
jgi:hypothetical protein